MKKLTIDQLYSALELARKVRQYEAAKDRLQGWTVPFVVREAFDQETINVAVPSDAVRKELIERILAAHQSLAALGIELVHCNEERA
jgi:hypothetical protein